MSAQCPHKISLVRHISFVRCCADIVRTLCGHSANIVRTYISRDICPHYILLWFSPQIMAKKWRSKDWDAQIEGRGRLHKIWQVEQYLYQVISRQHLFSAWSTVQPWVMTCLALDRHQHLNTRLHCNALHCTALYCSALHCTALHCTALHCSALYTYCTSLHCILYFIVLYFTVPDCVYFTKTQCTD